jgi:hypothetical protein
VKLGARHVGSVAGGKHQGLGEKHSIPPADGPKKQRYQQGTLACRAARFPHHAGSTVIHRNSHKLVQSDKQLAVKSNILKKIDSRCLTLEAVPAAGGAIAA